jgi:hypothetical protein
MQMLPVCSRGANVPSTGPLPASSIPSTHASVIFSVTFFGIGEKWEYDSPFVMLVECIDGARKTFSAGVSCAISGTSRLISSILKCELCERLQWLLDKSERDATEFTDGGRDPGMES